MEQILKNKYAIAKKAQKEWRHLLHATKPKENDCILLFPTIDTECNLQGMRYLDTYLQRVDRNKAVVITVDPNVKTQIMNYSDHISSIIEITEEQADELITLYELHIFDERFVVISLDKPFCRNGNYLVGYKDITVEQMVAIGIYSIIPFRPLEDGSKVI